MKSELFVAAGALPVTMFLLSNIGGNTAQITSGDRASVREAVGLASVAMLVAAASTGSMAATITTALAIAGAIFVMRDIWGIPSITEANPLS